MILKTDQLTTACLEYRYTITIHFLFYILNNIVCFLICDCGVLCRYIFLYSIIFSVIFLCIRYFCKRDYFIFAICLYSRHHNVIRVLCVGVLISNNRYILKPARSCLPGPVVLFRRRGYDKQIPHWVLFICCQIKI